MGLIVKGDFWGIQRGVWDGGFFSSIEMQIDRKCPLHLEFRFYIVIDIVQGIL